MAAFYIDDYESFGCQGYPTAADWEVALDPGFEQIIDSTYKDKYHVLEWHSKMPKIGEDGYYADLDIYYVRVRLYIDDRVSEWFYLPPKNQNEQKVIYTEENKEDIVYESSLAIGLK